MRCHKCLITKKEKYIVNEDVPTSDTLILPRTETCSKTMPGSLGHEEQDANTFASWVCILTLEILLEKMAH